MNVIKNIFKIGSFVVKQTEYNYKYDKLLEMYSKQIWRNEVTVRLDKLTFI